MTLSIALVNQKGGVGKTTLAIQLAAAAHLGGRRTLLIDMDEQGSASDWNAQRRPGSLLDGLTVVQSSRSLPRKRYLEMAAGYEVVLLDAPARLGDVTTAAGCFADIAVIPVQPGPLDIWAAVSTLDTLNQADAMRDVPMRRAFVLNRAVRGTSIALQATSIVERGGELLGVVHQRIAFANTIATGESVLSDDPGGEAAFEIRKLCQGLGLPTARARCA